MTFGSLLSFSISCFAGKLPRTSATAPFLFVVRFLKLFILFKPLVESVELPCDLYITIASEGAYTGSFSFAKVSNAKSCRKIVSAVKQRRLNFMEDLFFDPAHMLRNINYYNTRIIFCG